MAKVPTNLENISDEEFKIFLESFDYVLSDCDGVIWHKGPYPGVGDFFRRIKKLGKKVSYVSNNSLRSHEDYIQLFQSADIEEGVENLTYPSLAIADYLKSQNFNKTVFCVASTQTRTTLEEKGFKCKEGPLYGVDFYTDFVQYLEDDPEVGAVVFDSDFRVNLPKLYMASTYLQRPDVLFLAGATDRLVPLKKGVNSIGTGQFTDIVSGHTKRQPTILAKPGIPYSKHIMDKVGVVDPSRVLFIGDMIAQDVAFGKVSGFITLLVLTSHSHEEMMAEESIRPDYYASSLTNILPRLPQ